MPRSPLLAEREHQIMEVLWKVGEATSEEIRGRLPIKPPLREVTVRTMLRRMEQKKQVVHRVDGRTFVYRPLLEPDNVRSRAFSYVLNRFFGGSVRRLMAHIVSRERLSDKDLEQLRKQIDAARKRRT